MRLRWFDDTYFLLKTDGQEREAPRQSKARAAVFIHLHVPPSLPLLFLLSSSSPLPLSLPCPSLSLYCSALCSMDPLSTELFVKSCKTVILWDPLLGIFIIHGRPKAEWWRIDFAGGFSTAFHLLFSSVSFFCQDLRVRRQKVSERYRKYMPLICRTRPRATGQRHR